MSTETYTVTGITCGHCVSSVTAKILDLPAAIDVQVEFLTTPATVTSATALGEQ